VDLVRFELENSTAKFEVCCADRLSTGLSALTKETFAVVLLDLDLPDSRGAASFQSVMNGTAGVPVIVLTATADEAWAVEAVSRGAQGYIVKGAFGGNQLALTLRCAIERQARITISI
jgi:DNA-binding response OmpR family regulator